MKGRCIQLRTRFCIVCILGSLVLTPNAVCMFILCIIRHVLPCISACAALAGLTLNITAAHSCTCASASVQQPASCLCLCCIPIGLTSSYVLTSQRIVHRYVQNYDKLAHVSRALMDASSAAAQCSKYHVQKFCPQNRLIVCFCFCTLPICFCF